MKGKQALKRVFVLLLTGVTAVAMLAACSQTAETPDPASQPTVQTAESAAAPESQPAVLAEETAAAATPAPTPAPEELVLKGSSEVTAGKGIQLCPLTADGVDVDTASLTWQSSDESVAIVTNGWVDALRPGSVTITASGEGYTTVTQEVTVRQVSCTYCGQTGHTAGACPQKAADEQAAAQAAAAAEAEAQAQAQAAAESAAQQQAEEAAAPQEGICPVCGSQLNPDGSCNVIHDYAGYAMAYYDEEAGQVYIICNGCGQRFWRSDFADPRDFALNHGYPCCSRFDAGAGILP